MKVVHPTCCGVDVHKSFLVAVIVSTSKDGLTPRYEKKRFSTFNNDLKRFAAWLAERGCRDVCMESTGKYWIPIYNVLESAAINVLVANPKWVKAVQGNKDDNKDAKWIADLFRMGLPKGSFIPPKEIRLLRELTRYRTKLVGMRTSEKNRYQNAFTVCNVNLDSVVSDMFGKSATDILQYLTSDEAFDPQHCRELLYGTLKKKADDVVKAVEGCNMHPVQKGRVEAMRGVMTAIDDAISTIDALIDTIVGQEKYQNVIEFLSTIPGVKQDTAVVIISEIGLDMAPFHSSGQLCAWAGLVPGNNQSAGKKKSVRISRAGVYIKPALVQAAHAAVKCKDNSYYRLKYEQISKRRGKKRAIIAIARMILTAVYHMLNNGETWNPVDLYKLENPENFNRWQHAKAVNKARKLLQQEGWEVTAPAL